MIKLHNVDCINYLKEQKDEVFDIIIADPPYSSGGMTRSDRNASTTSKYLQSGSSNREKVPEFAGDNKDQRSYKYWSQLWMSEAMRCTKKGGVFLCFTDWRQLPITTDAIQAAGWIWRGVIPWYKGFGRPTPDRFTNSCEYIVFATNGPREALANADAKYPQGWYEAKTTSERIHVTQKPVDLYRHLYNICKNGEHIYDPFLGSGTSAIAAHIEGRGLKFTGTELVSEVFDIAQKKVKEVTAQIELFNDQP